MRRHALPVQSRRREDGVKLPALPPLLPPTCHLVCDPPLLRSTVVLMCSVLLMLTLSSPAPFSLPLPHCLQLHLFPSMWRMIAGLLFFFLFLMLHFSLLVLAPSLSLCPSSPSQPPTTPFSFSPPAHCHLLVPAQAPSRGLREAGRGVVRQNVHL